MRLISFLLVVAACSSPGPGPVRAAGSGDASGSAATTATAPASTGCPATFALATGVCAGGGVTSCAYPEGSCACAPDEPCHGGARVAPRPPGASAPQPSLWRCTPTPPAIRADGCPGQLPADGRCSQEGQSCDYQGRCFSGVTAVCTSGQWVAMPWPPPP